MGEIKIKIKLLNIIIFILVFSTTAIIINGSNANIDENTIYNIKNLVEYEKNIYVMKNVVENLRAEIETERSFASNYENNHFLDDIIKINSQIEKLKFYNGYTDVRGPGIMISVSDSIVEDGNLDIMERIIHDVDITVLLNDLKSAGAEAIDVNSKRIINISEVVCAGPILKINGEAVPAPFVIRAIGEHDALYNVVTEEGTYAYDLKNKYNMEVAVAKSYNLTIPKYRSNYEVEYAVSVER